MTRNRLLIVASAPRTLEASHLPGRSRIRGRRELAAEVRAVNGPRGLQSNRRATYAPVVIRPEDVDVGARWGRLRARRWGSSAAPLVVCVPGLAGNVENFAFLAERVAGDDLQLVAVDLRGRGHSETTAPGTYGWRRHAEDLFALADVLGAERFAIVGQSMGGSVAMKAAECDASRLQAVVLLDVAGQVDPGVAAVIAGSLARLGRTYPSIEQYLAEVRAQGLIDDWNDHWDRAYRYDVADTADGVRTRTRPEAVAEDRADNATGDPRARWSNLTMPTLLVRASRELSAGAGHVVPLAERARFAGAVPHARVVDVDGNHLTINTHADLPAIVRPFLLRATAQPVGPDGMC